MKKNIYCLIAVLLVGMPVVLPSLSQTFLQGIQAEEKEFEMYEEESEVNGLKYEELGETNLKEEGKLESPILELGETNVEAQIKDEYSVELEPEIAPANSIRVTTEEQLVEAVNNPDILEIITSNSLMVTKPLNIDREIIFGEYSGLTFSREGSLIITPTGKLTLSEVFMFYGETTAEALVTIDGGELRTLDSSVSSFIGIALNQTGDISTFIEIKNDGLFVNNAYLRIGEISNVNKLGTFIKMNGGKFIDTPSTILTGEVIAEKAIVSETGLNSHEFVYSGIRGGDTALTSRRGNPVYTNHDGATLVVNGEAPQLAAWMIESEDHPFNSLMHWNPDFGLGHFSFKVEQVGKARPMIHEISNSSYNHLFFNGIFPMFRGFRSASAETVFPPVRLPEGISVSPQKSNLLVGETVQLSETLSPDPSQLDTDEVMWVSENPEIAKVDEYGNVTAVGKGETDIKVITINGLSATTEIKVEDFTFEFIGVDGNSTAIVTGYHGTETALEIPSTAVNHEDDWISVSPVVGVGRSAFFNKGLKNVTIPDSITRIEYGAFQRNNLTELHLGSGITRIDELSFAENNLNNIQLANNITYIGPAAFLSNNLTELSIPEKVTYIGTSGFVGNTIEKVNFLGNVSDIQLAAFALNPLKNIIIKEKSLTHYQALLSPGVLAGVTERTILSVEESRYSDETQLINNLMVGDELSFSVLSKNRYQLANLEAFVWEEFIPNVQWFKDAQALPTESKQQFRIAEVEESDSGSYYAIVDGSELPSLSVEVSPLIQPDIPAINPEDGILDLENTNPVIEGLSLRYVSDLYFDATTFSSSNQTVYANNNDGIPKVTVQDMRSASKRNGWELQVRQNQLFMDGAELIFNPFVHEINQDLLNIKSHNGALTVNTEAQRFAGTTTTGNPSGIATMGMGSVDGSGVSLQIPGGVGVGIYEATLIWNLVATPSKANEHISGK